MSPNRVGQHVSSVRQQNFAEKGKQIESTYESCSSSAGRLKNPILDKLIEGFSSNHHQWWWRSEER